MATVTYKITNDCEIKGTFHQTKKKHAPLLMYIHGGGLVWGMKEDLNKEQIKLYTNAGFNIFSIDYQLAPETKLPDIISDVQDALVWLVEEGNKHVDFDPEKIAVIGASAGGYLALLTGTFKTRPKAIVSFYGYGDITGDWYTKPSPHYSKMMSVPEELVKQLIHKEPISAAPIEKRYAIYLYCRQQGKWIDYVTGIKPKPNKTEFYVYCPARLVDKQFPPTLLLHGNEDEDVPYQESAKMQNALGRNGVPSELITINGGKHTFDTDMEDAQVANAFEKVIVFLENQLL